MTPHFGRTELPDRQVRALRSALRIEWFTLAFLAVAITMVFLVMGNSQAMKAAWIEDMLSLAPPIAFLIAVRLVNRSPTVDYPYGFHRSVGVHTSSPGWRCSRWALSSSWTPRPA